MASNITTKNVKIVSGTLAQRVPNEIKFAVACGNENI